MEHPNNIRRGNRDMISSLPNCLLHLIMSFLTTHEAVRMCVLSKRWKNLWTTLPFLNFDLDKFMDNTRDWYYNESEDAEPERQDYFKMFRNFVNATIVLREDTDLLKFRISCSEMPYDFYDKFITSWICYALKHSPQVLHIDASLEGSLPLGLFSCASLVDLSIFGFEIDPSPVVNLPCLKRLYLRGIYLYQDFMKQLLCGCPVLEYLHLEICNIKFSGLHSQSLKYLKIEGYCGPPNNVTAVIAMEFINAPNLLSFHYDGCAQYIIGHKVFLNMPSLTSAIISTQRCTLNPSYNGNSKILTGISSAESINLSGFWIKESLENELSKLPKFENAVNLSVGYLCLKCNFNLLASFIEHFPNLKILSLWDYGCFCKVEAHGNQESLKIAPFKCKQLHTVNVTFFNYDKNFHWVIKYLQDGTESLRAKINTICLSGRPYCAAVRVN